MIESRVAGVARDHMCDITTEDALVPQADGRDAQALAEHVRRAHVEGAGNTAADIGPMPVGLRKGDRLAVREDRPDETDIGEMRAARIGIVDGEDIARMHVIAEEADHVLAGPMQGADMDRDIAVALGDGIAVRVIQRV